MDENLGQIVLVKDIDSNRSSGSFPNNLFEYNGRLYFSADDGATGSELWVSDGTTEGTNLVVDINSGTNGSDISNSSYPENFTEFNGKLYFTAIDSGNQRKLWVSDGTAEGTNLVLDPNSGDEISNIGDLAVFNNELYFSTSTEETGNELFKLTFDDTEEPINVIDGGSGQDNIVGTEGADQIDGGGGRDTLDGGAGNDTLIGGGAADSLLGGVGDDELQDDKGQDTLDGGAGNDILIGGNNRDSLLGGDGNDELQGDGGRDTLDGGAGNDILIGGGANDSLVGGIGDDTLTGGKGKDLFAIAEGTGTDAIADFELGRDSFGLAGGLQFEQLTLSGDSILLDESVLITTNIDTSSLTADDFIEV